VTVAPDTLAGLRDRLLDMRDELVEQLAEADVLDGGLLALLGDVGGALAALELDDVSGSKGRRGGDPYADKRAQRDDTLCALADLVGGDAPGEEIARQIASRLARFHPMPNETEPERLLMRQVIDAGLPVPGPDRIARIIRGR
jgi:hypothetical protein